MMRSPSFSRSSSSTTTTISPRAIAAMASAIGANGRALSVMERLLRQRADVGQDGAPAADQVPTRSTLTRCDRARGRRWSSRRAREQRQAVPATHEGGREVEHVLVDEAGVVERRGRGGAPLHEDLQHLAPAELVEHAAEVTGQLQARMDRAPGRRLAEHHPQRVATLHVAHGQRRVVGSDRAGAHQDGVALGPQAVGVGAGLRRGDPLARTVGRRGAAVERRGQLQHDPRAPGAAMRQVRRQLAADGARLRSHGHLDAGGAQLRDTASRDLRIGVLDAHHHPADAGIEQGAGARRCAPVVAARLERGDHRGPPQVGSRGPGRGQRHDLGVRSARWRGRPLEAIPGRRDDHGADPGVG